MNFFGNDVDSIRIFDPETQLSERKLLQVSIIPNVETQFDGKEKISLLGFIPENTVIWMQDWEFIKERILIQEEELLLFLEIGDKGYTRIDDEEDKVEKKELSRADFITASSVEEYLENHHLVEFNATG